MLSKIISVFSLSIMKTFISFICITRLLVTTILFMFFSFLSFSQSHYIQIEYTSSEQGKQTIPYTADNARMALLSPDGKVYISRRSFFYKSAENNDHLSIILNPKTFYQGTVLKGNRLIWNVDSTSSKRVVFEKTNQTKSILGYACTLYRATVFSNQIQLWITQEIKGNAGPTSLGVENGVVLEYNSNNTRVITASKISVIKKQKMSFIPPVPVDFLSSLDYADEQFRNSFVTLPVFENLSLGFQPEASYSDSFLHFSNGTLVIREMTFPTLSDELIFLDVSHKSTGDAYDRTGSVFLMTEDQFKQIGPTLPTLFSDLPSYPVGSGKHNGTVASGDFSPPFELMRFFTSFGIGHYNTVDLKGKDWAEKSDFRQDITHYKSLLSGKKVYLGINIGTWTKYGHEVSANITLHPGESTTQKTVISLMYSVPVLEMQGNAYPHHFIDTAGVTLSFDLTEDQENVVFRYTSTGHGGYSGGDEFQFKTNSISLDGNLVYKMYPWRSDCGSYRLQNPASGNFKNGLSSSDFSRSNWCPGQVTNPYFIPLGPLKAGRHELRIVIPEEPSNENAQNMWFISGQIIY